MLRTRRHSGVVLFLALSLLAWRCDDDEDDPRSDWWSGESSSPQLVVPSILGDGGALCGVPAGSSDAGPVQSTCSFADPVFGPQVYQRTHGAAGDDVHDDHEGSPGTVTSTFSVVTSGTFCVRAVHDGVPSATVRIDGEEVFGPSDFNAHPATLVRELTLSEGPHLLSVRVRGRPGRTLTGC